MPDVTLGISGAEVTLPSTIAISLPTDIGKQVSSEVLADGNTRFAFYAGQGRWQLSWVQLTYTELGYLITLRGYNQTLQYTNNYESATAYTVVITSLSYDVINPGATTTYYTATMTLEQAI
jgi:hypothetical protein